MYIGEICNREVVVADKSSSITAIAKLMREYHVGSVVITEIQNECHIPVGIITDRDLVIEIMAKAVSTASVTAGDIMTTELTMVRESHRLWDTIQLMCGKGVRRAPVINDENVLIGIITVDDILEVVISELDNITRLMAVERSREKRLRH